MIFHFVPSYPAATYWTVHKRALARKLMILNFVIRNKSTTVVKSAFYFQIFEGSFYKNCWTSQIKYRKLNTTFRARRSLIRNNPLINARFAEIVFTWKCLFLIKVKTSEKKFEFWFISDLSFKSSINSLQIVHKHQFGTSPYYYDSFIWKGTIFT